MNIYKMHKPLKTIITSTVLLFLSLIAFNGYTQEEQFIEGGHYELLDEVQPVQTGEKIEVVEMFWYRCPHCYRLEPFIVEWEKNKPENAEYVAIPALLNPNWEFHARAYYTFESLGVLDQLHGAFFTAIHEQRKDINTVEALANWAAENGVDHTSVIETFSSFAVENKINFANVMSRKYGITGVPAIIVDGRYRTSVSLAGSHDKLIDVINFLVEKAAEARAG
jgi:thiol:disulfide interchange protein DsbA